MLTSFTWVPKGGMKPQPLFSTDSTDEVRRKLQLLDGSEEGQQQGSTANGTTRRRRVLRGGPEQEALDDDEKSNVNSTLRNVAGGGGDAILEQVESDDEDELEDRTFKDTDLVFAVSVAQTDAKEASRVDLYTYDEPEDNVFIHHDVEIAAFPLSTVWLTDGTMSLLAVSSMLPFVEIWPLDVMDAVAPLMVLGGCVNPDHNYKKRRAPANLQPDSHSEPILTMAWNATSQNIMATGSADHTIKIWDLQEGGGHCLGTYREDEKVQSLAWSPQDPNLLLSGGFDAVMRLRDCRAPQQQSCRFAMNGEVVERVEFVPQVSMPSAGAGVAHVMASTSAGSWAVFDTRHAAQPLWSLTPHMNGGELTFNCSMQVPGLFATGGKDDGQVALWDARQGGAPSLVVARDYGTGGVLSIAFHPNAPHILGACGMAGEPLVYTMVDDLKAAGW